MRNSYLEITGGSKYDGSQAILQDFSFLALKQEITYIVGGSVLEMSMIADILSGKENLTTGVVSLNGDIIDRNGNTKELKRIVNKLTGEQTIIESVSLTDNFFICMPGKPLDFVAKDKKYKALLQELIDSFGIEIDAGTNVSLLSALQRFEILLLKCFFHTPDSIVFVDKRTTFFSEEEFQEILRLMNALKQRGMTFIVLDYMVGEYLNNLDRIAVVRNARTVVNSETAMLNRFEKEILQQLTDSDAEKRWDNDSKCILEMNGVCTQHFDNLTFKVHQGELIAVHYSDVDLAEHFFRILSGEEGIEGGIFCVDGQATTAKNRFQRVAEGITGIDNVSYQSHLFMNMKAWENYCLPRGLIFRELWHKESYRKYLKKQLNAVAGRNLAEQETRTLSPKESIIIKYQAQKIAAPKVVVCANPFSTVDLLVRTEVAKQIQELTSSGIAVIVISGLWQIRNKDGYNHYELTENGLIG